MTSSSSYKCINRACKEPRPDMKLQVETIAKTRMDTTGELEDSKIQIWECEKCKALCYKKGDGPIQLIAKSVGLDPTKQTNIIKPADPLKKKKNNVAPVDLASNET